MITVVLKNQCHHMYDVTIPTKPWIPYQINIKCIENFLIASLVIIKIVVLMNNIPTLKLMILLNMINRIYLNMKV